MSTTPPAAPSSPSSPKPYRLAVIIGSTRDGRFGPTVGQWFTALAEQHAAAELDVIDVAGLELPACHPDWGTERTPALAELAARIEAADAYVVVTPEYNHSYPAHLKHFIDLHRTEWNAKPVGFVSYGGVSGGLRAVEHLRQVFAEVHCVTIRDGVSFHQAWDHFGEDGKAHDPQGAAGAAKTMLDQLDWWARTLRAGRAERPYN